MIKNEQILESISKIDNRNIRELMEMAFRKRLAYLEAQVREKATDFAYMELKVYMSQVGPQFKHAEYTVPFGIGNREDITVHP